MTASISVRSLGVRFLFDGQRDVVTPMRARLALRTSEVWGLRELDLSVEPGESVALIGPTGSGKTTLLRVMAGVLPADRGEVRVKGNVGSMLSIDAGLLPTLTGRENAVLLAVLGGLSRARAKSRLDSIRERSGLGASFELPASSYSQGMRARLAFAAAIECYPDLILLDEVHEAFDHAYRAVLEATAREVLARGGIVVAAGHDHEILSRLCSRAALLSTGRIVDDGPFDRVREGYVGEEAGEAERLYLEAR
jgi:ABC-type polysaccharide/polyol phosphate transport system ATPase subunit